MLAQSLDREFPRPIVAPGAELLMHRLPAGKIDGHLPPLATGLHHIQKSVHDTAQLILARTPARMTLAWGRLQQGLQYRPLCVRQIARVHIPKLKAKKTDAYTVRD